EVGGELKLTRMEYDHAARQYYSVNGYPLRDGLRGCAAVRESFRFVRKTWRIKWHATNRGIDGEARRSSRGGKGHDAEEKGCADQGRSTAQPSQAGSGRTPQMGEEARLYHLRSAEYRSCPRRYPLTHSKTCYRRSRTWASKCARLKGCRLLYIRYSVLI